MKIKKPFSLLSFLSFPIYKALNALYSRVINKAADKITNSWDTDWTINLSSENIALYISILGLGMIISTYWLNIAKYIRNFKNAKFFKPIHFILVSRVVNENEYGILTLKIKFLKTVSNASIQILVNGCLIKGEPKQKFCSTLSTKDYLLDSEENVKIASIPKRREQNALWGDEENTLIKHSRNMVTLRVTNGKRKQDFKLFVDLPSNEFGVYYFTENEDFWESENK